MKFKFIGEHTDLYTDKTVSTVTIETRAEGLDDVLKSFEDFLRGCGYVLNGTLDIIPEEEYHEYDDTIAITPDDGIVFDFGGAQPTFDLNLDTTVIMTPSEK